YARAASAGLPADGRAPGIPVRPEDSPLDSATRAAASVLKRNRGLEAKIAHRLDGAGSRWRPAEWLLFHSGVFLLSCVLGLLIRGGDPGPRVLFMCRARLL